MTNAGLAEGGLDDARYRCGTSKLPFRGPHRRPGGRYVVAVGGTETFGKYVDRPYPDFLEDRIGLPVINFGAVNAGIDVFVSQRMVLDACSGSQAVVLQAMGAHNLSNRFYCVHPRRNDRFLRASPELRALYPDIDFTDFAFTRHLIRTLVDTDPDRFAVVKAELCAVWLARMTAFLVAVPAPVVLLWMAGRLPDDPCTVDHVADPLFVTDEMIEVIRPLLAGIVIAPRCGTSASCRSTAVVCGHPGTRVAAMVPDAGLHRDVAQAVARGLRDLI